MLAVSALLATLALPPACGDGPKQPARRALVDEINARRSAADRAPLELHPVLCGVAAWRLAGVEQSGRAAPDLGTLQEASQRFYRAGYPPHAWIEATVLSDPRFPRMLQWEEVKPEWLAEAASGEWEHIGVAVGAFGALEVATVVVALPKCRAEEKQVAPLRDVEAMRLAALAEVARQRAERGLRPVEDHPALDLAAQAWAERMQREGLYRHVAPDGSRPAKRAREAGWTGSGGVSENIAKGIFTPRQAVERWMNSSEHRRNILDPEATATGLGVTVGPPTAPGECFEVVWVQMFARGRP